MARSFPADTQNMKCLEERFNKERDSQLAWYIKKKNEGSNEETSSKQMEVFKRKLDMMAPKTNLSSTTQNLTSKTYNKTVKKFDDKALIDASIDEKKAFFVEMRPVTPRTKKQLFDGFTKEGRGRHQYLRSRYLTAPEDKFQYPLISSWEYGWRLGDVIKTEDLKKPAFGRTRLINDTFFTRTGIPAQHGVGMLQRSKTIF